MTFFSSRQRIYIFSCRRSIQFESKRLMSGVQRIRPTQCTLLACESAVPGSACVAYTLYKSYKYTQTQQSERDLMHMSQACTDA